MDSSAIASQLVMTWKASGGLDSKDLTTLTKMITVVIRETEAAEKRKWLACIEDRSAGEHVITAIQTRFPDVSPKQNATQLIKTPKRYTKRSR